MIISNDKHHKVNTNIPSKRRGTMKEEMTTMKVSIKNRDILAKLAKYGESLDDALTRLFKMARLQEGKGE